jgi:hypothetical protein
VTLHELCAARGLTLDQLAARAGGLPPTVAKLAAGILRGDGAPVGAVGEP